MVAKAKLAFAGSVSALTMVIAGPAAAREATARTSAPLTVPDTDTAQPAAQDTAQSPAEQTGVIPDIIVTAQKRSESISKAPVAISAIGQGVFDRLGATNLADVVKTVPSVAVNTNGLSIRGLGAVTTLGFGSPTVAFHVDGIYQENFSPNLYDIERIEVLRGPQGTLYGRNSTAGVVNVITARPQDRWVVAADLATGSYGRMVGRGTLNIPITPSLAVRGAVTYEYSQGSQFNPGDTYTATGVIQPGKKGDSLDRLVGRVAVRWHPGGVIDWNVNATWEEDYSRLRLLVPGYYANFPNVTQNLTTPIVISPQLPAVKLIIRPGVSDYSGAIVYPSNYPREWAYSPTGSGAVGTFAQRNASAMRTFAVRSNLLVNITDTVSATYLFGYKRYKDNGRSQAVPFAQNDQYIDYEDQSHEANLNYNGSRARGVLGLYYFKNDGVRDQFTRVWVPTLSTDATAPYVTPDLRAAVGVGTLGRNVRQTTKAVFGQLTLDLTPRFRLTGGARYNEDTVNFSAYSTSLCPFGFGLSPSRPDPNGVCATLAALPNIAYAAITGTPITGGQLGGQQPFPAGFNPFTTGRIVTGAATKFDKLSWKGTVEYDFSPDVLGYATVASGYKAGGVGDQTQVGTARFYQPETDINYEMGIRSKLFDDRISLNVTGFWTDYKNLQVPEIRTIAGRPGTVITNAGRSRSRGIEVEYGWALSPNDRITGYATYLDARFKRFENVQSVFLNTTLPNVNGSRLANSPKFTVRGAYSHIFDLGALGVLTPTLQGQYQTKSFTSYLNSVEQRIDAYFIGDVSVRFDTRDGHMFVEGIVNNVTDKNYVLSDFPVTGGGIQLLRYAQGRTFLGRVGFKF